MRFLLLVLVPLVVFAEDVATTVASENAHFNGESITLAGGVKIFNESYEIRSKHAVFIKDEKHLSALEFPWIELSDDVSASFYQKYFLQCCHVYLDYLQKTILFLGEGKRVYFQDEENELYADKALVDYEEENEKFVLKKITLTGNIEMRVLDNEEKKEQYACADIVECFPEEESVILKGTNNNRVLFFDKGRGVTISAEMVKAQKKEGKEVVEGMGDVRFVFKDDEIEKLKNQFGFKNL